jgi:predicted nucleotidyltransferase component of viral defense system
MDEPAIHMFRAGLERNHNSVDMALVETVQSIVLLGLSRTDFFAKAAFYGGTALRLLMELDRFSEDLDFSLAEKKTDFTLGDYFTAIQDELQSFGFSAEIHKKEKLVDTAIESAFIKMNTRIHVLNVGIPSSVADLIHRNQVCKVKIEVDTDPPEGADFTTSYVDNPVPFPVRSYSAPALFAGKLDAVLSRAWKNRIKGRDWYDFAWLARRKVPVLLTHLEQRLRQKGFYTDSPRLSLDALKEMLDRRIAAVDLESARQDVSPFIPRPQDLNVWSKEYFRHVVQTLIAADQ